LPLTLCTGSTTTATARWFNASKDCSQGSNSQRGEQQWPDSQVVA
jgi:hypothetical protein